MHGALRAAGAREVGLCPDEIEHTGQQETALWARWGAHRERVEQTRRQRLGVARRSANTHGIARHIPVFWVWGGR